MLPVAKHPPLLDQNFGFSQAQKNLTVQAFIAKTVVEALDVDFDKTLSETVRKMSCC